MQRQPIAIQNLRLQPFTTFGPEGVILAVGTGPSAALSNPMTVSWGFFGTMWERPMVMVAVRPSRHTHGLIASSPDFTLSWLPDHLVAAVNVCGQASGRDGDKWDLSGLSPKPGTKSLSPVVDEATLTMECRILARQALDPDGFVGNELKVFYQKGDHHTLIFGELIAVHGQETDMLNPR